MKKILFGLVITTAVMISCDSLTVDDENGNESKANACFDYTPSTDIKAGDEISFMNCSDSAGYYVWDFGDDSISFEENPTHTYANPGTYRVILLANNEPVIDFNADGLINTDEITETIDTTSRVIVVGAGSEASNYISFKGTKYALNYGQFWSVSEFESDITGRYHEIILTDNEYTEANEDTYTGNFMNITITTDASSIGDIIGDFSQEGWSDEATDAPDYAWIGVDLEGYEDGEYNQFYVEMETVSAFTISQDGNDYIISISGTGVSGDGVTEESGAIEVYYKGELSWWP